MDRRRKKAVRVLAAWVCLTCAAPSACQAVKGTVNLGAALTAAARRGDVARVKALLRQGANVDAKGKLGATPLMSAAMEGHADVVRALLQAGANPNAQMSHPRKGWTGPTPLAWAATNGHTEVVRLLLSKGAAVNARVFDRKTPLMLAAMWGYTDVVRTLLARRARADLKDAHGKTALDYAREGKVPGGPRRREGHTECIKLLVPALSTAV